MSIDSDKVLLYSDKCLDTKSYNETFRNITWKDCTLRSWLNGYGMTENFDNIDYTKYSFYGTAFNDREKKEIQLTSLDNSGNSKYKTLGSEDTTDKIFLLSLTDIMNEKYGFCISTDNCKDRIADITGYSQYNTDYFIGQYSPAELYWLRLSGYDYNSISQVDDSGYISVGGFQTYYGGNIDVKHTSIRPAMYVNRAYIDNCVYAGEVFGKCLNTASINEDSTKEGTIIKDKKTDAIYKIIDAQKNKSVEYVKCTDKDKVNVSIKATITYKNKKYKVVRVADKAFMNCKKLKKVIIGKNVKK